MQNNGATFLQTRKKSCLRIVLIALVSTFPKESGLAA